MNRKNNREIMQTACRRVIINCEDMVKLCESLKKHLENFKECKILKDGHGMHINLMNGIYECVENLHKSSTESKASISKYWECRDDVINRKLLGKVKTPQFGEFFTKMCRMRPGQSVDGLLV